MNNRMIWLVILCAVLLVPVLPAGQTAATRAVMHDKLELSHHVLDAIMTSNLAVLEHDAGTLARINERPGWMVLTTPEYARYSAAFITVAQDLAAAARDQDLDAAAVRYASMTMACYQCHRYVKSARMARR